MSTRPGRSVMVEPVVNMVRAMVHRGPDGEGVFVAGRGDSELFDAMPGRGDISVADPIIALGHSRLAIVDTSSGAAQPMVSRDGRFVLVFNGEIYNYRSLALELRQHGYSQRSQSDTEVLLNAFEFWGKACVHHLRGDFAFGVWDVRRKELVLARDRLGVKPLHYVRETDQFTFASDAHTLLSSGLFESNPDPTGLPLSMLFNIAPRPLTAFEGINGLEAGCLLTVQAAGAVRTERYWSIPIGTQDESMTERDAVSGLNDRLRRAVSHRLEADVPVGSFMSGGIDSTTVTAIAGSMDVPIKSITLGFRSDDPDYDEVPRALATAAIYANIEPVVEWIEPDRAIKHVRDWIIGYEEPTCLASAGILAAETAKRSGLKVVLSGLGGDELFAGYDSYRRIRKWRIAKQTSGLMRLAARFGVQKGVTAGQLARLSDGAELHTHLNTKTPAHLVRRYFRKPFVEVDPIEYLANAYPPTGSFGDDFEAMAYLDLRNQLGNHQLLRGDRFSMAHSVEVRFPFLDHELVEFAFRIPTRHKFGGGESKKVLRRVAAEYVDPSCLAAPKRGFGLPLELWMAGPLRQMSADAIGKLQQRETVIDPAVVGSVWSEYLEGKMPYEYAWHLVNLELWFEEFIDPTWNRRSELTY